MSRSSSPCKQTVISQPRRDTELNSLDKNHTANPTSSQPPRRTPGRLADTTNSFPLGNATNSSIIQALLAVSLASRPIAARRFTSNSPWTTPTRLRCSFFGIHPVSSMSHHTPGAVSPKEPASALEPHRRVAPPVSKHPIQLHGHCRRTLRTWKRASRVRLSRCWDARGYVGADRQGLPSNVAPRPSRVRVGQTLTATSLGRVRPDQPSGGGGIRTHVGTSAPNTHSKRAH